MMSVIIEFPDGKIRLYSKGADNIITTKLSKLINNLAATEKYLLYFASKGLRTLMIAYRDIEHKEYKKWQEAYRVF